MVSTRLHACKAVLKGAARQAYGNATDACICGGFWMQQIGYNTQKRNGGRRARSSSQLARADGWASHGRGLSAMQNQATSSMAALRSSKEAAMWLVGEGAGDERQAQCYGGLAASLRGHSLRLPGSALRLIKPQLV